MTADHEGGERIRDPHRFLTFIDAIVAIAVTLLVLPLVDAVGELDPDKLSYVDFLRDSGGRLFTFLLSFVVIALVWVVHHGRFGHIRQIDAFVLYVTLFWALTIVLVPFPTALSAVYSDRTSTAFYIGLLLVNSLSQTAVTVHLARTPALWSPTATPEIMSPRPSIAVTFWYAIALVVALTVPHVRYWALSLLFLARPTAAVWTRMRSRSAG